jgi:membrane-bound metal-dependent hydrolase YbcI (DUF457 family)
LNNKNKNPALHEAKRDFYLISLPQPCYFRTIDFTLENGRKSGHSGSGCQRPNHLYWVNGVDMTWPTHSLFGMNTVWLLMPLIPLFPDSNVGVLSAVAAFGSLLPDLDASESKIKHLKLIGTEFKPFMLPALVVSRTDQHRGLLHSLWGLGMMGLVALCAIPWIGSMLSLAFLLGYASHLVADAATKSGIRLLYPTDKRYHVLPKPLRITTGSLAEESLLPFLAAGIFFLLINHLSAI